MGQPGQAVFTTNGPTDAQMPPGWVAPLDEVGRYSIGFMVPIFDPAVAPIVQVYPDIPGIQVSIGALHSIGVPEGTGYQARFEFHVHFTVVTADGPVPRDIGFIVGIWYPVD
ncbi:hypothetical protein OG948_55840 (plasmid) [Embleya sp. NBC_00888]|uniref:hypothetical protein n=1 Tax=Embleya sp. NBC_00888 TaxID=2975960 RepID=UPI002F91A975|nr:hypothetical protein OG948_55840 [Embleya sp. NBC_00888]